jgi:hypothetical protein
MVMLEHVADVSTAGTVLVSVEMERHLRRTCTHAEENLLDTPMKFGPHSRPEDAGKTGKE